MTTLKCPSSIARAFAAVILFLFHALALAAPGDIDFVTKTRVPNGNNQALAVAVQPDGKFVTVGTARYGNKQWSIVRYNVDGTLDTTFNGTGYVLEPLGSTDGTATSVVWSTGGYVNVGGWVTDGFRESFAVARFVNNGNLDGPFGGGGTITNVGEGNARAQGVAVQDSDGKVLLAGWAMQGGKKVIALVRYNLNCLLDGTFGTGGIVLTPVGSVDAFANAIAVQGDGKIVVTGRANGQMVVVRYNANGSLDTTFAGGSGIASIGAGTLEGRSIALQADGKIVAGGNATNGTGTAFVVARLDVAGTPDATFNATGKIVIPYALDTADLKSLRVQGDGKIVVSGTSRNAANTTDSVALARLTAAGGMDSGFGSGGQIVVAVTNNDHATGGIGVLNDGRYVVAGGVLNTSYDEFVAVFGTNGLLDNAFQANGTRELDIGSTPAGARGVALQSDGKIVAAGTVRYEAPQSGTKAMVARYNANGSLDTTFGAGGMVLLDNAEANAVAIQGDGRIVIAGSTGAAGSRSIAVARLTAAGALDATFGSGGSVAIPVGGTDDYANAVRIQSDGKIVAAGRTKPGAFSDSVFVRLNANGSLDGAFGSAGVSVVSMGGGAEEIYNIRFQADGKIVGAGVVDYSSSQRAFGVVRLNTDGTPDAGFAFGGVAVTAFGTGSATGRGLAIQADGKIVVAGYAFNGSNDDFALARYNPDGGLDTTFGSGGKVTTEITTHNRAFDVVVLPSGKIDVVGEWGSWGVVGQYLPNGTFDTSFALGGYVNLPLHWGHDQLLSVARQSDGNLVMAADATGVFAVTRVIGDTSAVTAARKVKRDFNYDGKSDIVWQNTDGTQVAWLMDGTTATGGLQLVGPGTGWTVKLTADFDGNGTADILWQHTDGSVVMWLMNGTTVIGGAQLMGPGTGWTPQMTGDFDGDGKADIVWRNADGRQHLWLMNGTTITGGAGLVGAGTGWTVKQLVDLNGDGKADILWQHTDGTVIAWLMNGATQITSTPLVGAGNWTPIQVGDFNGDGKGDILWRHTDGTVILWLMNGTTQITSRALVGAGPWTVTHVGDFDGDGKSDIIWRNTTDGTTIQWLMNGTTPTQTPVLVGANTGWTLRALADFNGDGNADIVWQHTDGTTVAWLMNGTTVTAGTQLVGAGTGWSVMP